MKKPRWDEHTFQVVKHVRTAGCLLSLEGYKHDLTSCQDKLSLVPNIITPIGLVENTQNRRREHPPPPFIKIPSKFSYRSNVLNKMRNKGPVLKAFRSTYLVLYNSHKKSAGIPSVDRCINLFSTTRYKYIRKMLVRHRLQSLRCGLLEFLSKTIQVRCLSFIQFPLLFPRVIKYLDYLISFRRTEGMLMRGALNWPNHIIHSLESVTVHFKFLQGRFVST
jgi:hypothetical protein